ncbi:zinc-ribbon domain-containing protein [Ferruginibacter albus]|uniref:zinc-ribbon domain-containing protein n=1 Tax=Ferruginibacter albus TaxID=2875540 RepID=UPI001CC38814|nr:zinc-ribbon domain-containing protein [Ferruginibacter albus]UAY52995.1 zinc ribbon domain-containing protein [Ferruginibacter albus]
MFFLFGTNKSKLKHKYFLKNCKCPVCGQLNTLDGSVTGRYFHLFFIPLFPAGKEKSAKCSHCNSTINEKSFTPEMKQEFMIASAENPNKTPFWHGCGCLAIVLLVLVILLSAAYVWFKHRHDPPKAEDYRKVAFNADEKKLDDDSLVPLDSISVDLKNCLDNRFNDVLEKDKFRYFCKINQDRVLVLLKIEDIKKIKADDRHKLIPIIEKCLNNIDGLAGKEVYIGVEGKWNMILTSSPMKEDLDGSFADEDILYPFYDTSKTVQMDSVIIKSKRK